MSHDDKAKNGASRGSHKLRDLAFKTQTMPDYNKVLSKNLVQVFSIHI